MKPALAKPVLFSFLLLLVLLAVNAGVSYYYTRALHKNAQVAESYNMLDALSDTLALVNQAEIGQHSYVLTGDPAFLESYQSAFTSRSEIVGRLRRLTADEPGQQRLLSQLDEKLTQRMQTAEQAIAMRREQGFDAAKDYVQSGIGKSEVRDIRALVAEMRKAENEMLQDRTKRAGRSFSVATLAELAMLLLVLAASTYAFIVIRREILSRFRAEAYAHEQREWCLTTLTSIGDAVIVTDTRGEVVLLNAVAGKLTGWEEEAVGKPLNEVFRIVNETTRKAVENPVEKVLREGTIVGLANHTVLINRDGVDVPIDDSGAPVRNKNGDLTGVVLVFRDITERRRAEEALLRNQRQFHLIADTIPQLVWMARGDGSIEYLNRRWLEYSGTPPPKGWKDVIHPDDLPGALEKWSHSLASGEAFETEFRLRRADGNYLWHIAQALPLRDDQGRVINWFGSCTDFNEQKRALDAQHESEERLKFALSAARIIAWDWDFASGTVIRSDNSREIMGLPTGTAKDFKELVHADDLPQLREATAKALRGEAPYDIEFRIGTRDGRLIWLHDKARLQVDAVGRPTHLTGIGVDITDRKRAETLLLDADRRKNEFLAMLAHELRNPLAPIRSAAEILRLLGPKDEKLNWARDVIERQVRHMTRLIDDLLDISRISRGRITLQKNPVNVVSAVAGAMETVRPFIEARKQTVDIVMPAEPGSVYGDATRLIQVLTNLLHNAMKYTPEAGRITLTVSKAQEQLYITIRDTGIGIAEDQLERVFDLFTQLDETRERSQGGLGIGLTLVKTLVEMHGGIVLARSEGRGKGSEFTVRLPLLPDVPEIASVPRKERVEAARTKQSLRILVVDDNRDAAESLSTLLQLLGHSTRAASDGANALAVAREFAPELVFVDIDMPGMRGYEVCQRLRQLTESLSVVCIALTGFGSEEDRARSRDAGFDHHLVKPVDLKVLQDLLSRVSS